MYELQWVLSYPTSSYKIRLIITIIIICMVFLTDNDFYCSICHHSIWYNIPLYDSCNTCTTDQVSHKSLSSDSALHHMALSPLHIPFIPPNLAQTHLAKLTSSMSTNHILSLKLREMSSWSFHVLWPSNFPSPEGTYRSYLHSCTATAWLIQSLTCSACPCKIYLIYTMSTPCQPILIANFSYCLGSFNYWIS